MNEQNIDRSQIEKYLTKVSEDKIFADSPRYKDILHFLVTESLDGKHIKELNIAARIYGDDFSEDKSDGRVRVYIFNLRKRLNSYYKSAGSEDEVIFTLEKGSYNMQFKSREVVSEQEQTQAIKGDGSGNRWLYFGYGIAASIALALATWAAIWGFSGNSRNLYCWDSFIKSDTPILSILADQIIIQRKIEGEWMSGASHHTIKNKTMFQEYIIKHPTDSLRLANYTLFSKAAPYALHRLTEWLAQYDKHTTLTSDSDFSLDDIDGTNIIYLGQIKTMNASNNLFLKGSKRFSADPKFIYIKSGKHTKRYRAKFDTKDMLVTEYAIVSYMPLKGDNKALFFTSNHDIGTIATLNNFTNREFLERFYESLPSKDSYFNALFRVEGIGRTNISCDLVELEIL